MIDKVKSNIANGNIKEAVKILQRYIKNNSIFENEIIGISSRFNQLNSNILKGILSNEEISIEKAKISQSILEICELFKTKEKKRKTTKSRKGLYFISIILILLISPFIFNLLSSKTQNQGLLREFLDKESFDNYNQDLILKRSIKDSVSSFATSLQSNFGEPSFKNNEAQTVIEFEDVNSDALPDILSNSKENIYEISNTEPGTFSSLGVNSINYAFVPNLSAKEYFDIGMSFHSIHEYTKAQLNLTKAIQDSINYLEAYIM